MTTTNDTAPPATDDRTEEPAGDQPRAGLEGYRPGPLGRLGVWVTEHRKLTGVVWMLLVVGLGIFAPRVEAELSGAGWQADGSESVAVREAGIEKFGGNASSAIQVVVHSDDGPVTKGEGAEVLAEAARILDADPRVAQVFPPQPGTSISADGSTAVLLAGAGADTNEMVRVADDLKAPLEDLSTRRDRGQPHRFLAAVVGLQRGQPRRDAQVRDVLVAGDARRSWSWRSAPWSRPGSRCC